MPRKDHLASSSAPDEGVPPAAAESRTVLMMVQPGGLNAGVGGQAFKLKVVGVRTLDEVKAQLAARKEVTVDAAAQIDILLQPAGTIIRELADLPSKGKVMVVAPQPAPAPDGRPAMVWIDRCCFDRTNIALSLTCLPIYIAGCKTFLVLAGPTFSSRLWCALEVFVFVRMGGKTKRATGHHLTSM